MTEEAVSVILVSIAAKPCRGIIIIIIFTMIPTASGSVMFPFIPEDKQ